MNVLTRTNALQFIKKMTSLICFVLLTQVSLAQNDPDVPDFAKYKIDKEAFMKQRAEAISKMRGVDETRPFNPKLRTEAIRQMEIQKAQNASRSGTSGSNLINSPWTAIGPMPIPNGQTQTVSTAVSGRTISVAVHPTNPDIVYVGTAQGGLYRTTDGGTNWTPIMDNAASLAIGAIAISPSNPELVYVGTGEPNFSSDSYFGVGVYRISNASTTANLTGPLNKDAFNADIFSGRSIGNIAVHPTNPDVIFVSSTSGVGGLRSTNSVFPSRGIYRCDNATSGAPVFNKLTGLLGNLNVSVRDIAIDPTNPNVLIAVPIATGTNQGGIYQSANALAAPGSVIFTQRVIVNSTSTSTLAGELAAVHPTGDANATFYAAMGVSNGRVYRSTDGGVTWTIQITNAFCGTQCFYDIAIAVDPANVNNVYLGGNPNMIAAKSINGGISFTDNNLGLHVDTHVLMVSPSNSSIVWLGTDGGIYKSTDAGLTWTHKNTTQFSATQFMGLDVHPTDNNFTIGGTQDNGTNLYQPNATWTRTDFGDGGWAVIDQNAADNVNVRMYHTYFNATTLQGYGTVASTVGAFENWAFRGCQSSGATTNGITCTGTINFYAPLVRGPGNPNTIYYGSDRLYRSANNGVNHTVVSQNPIVSGVPISCIGISPQNDNVRIVGLNNGALWGTTTGSATLVNLDALNAVPDVAINSTTIDPNNSNTAYVTLSTFGFSTVWKTTTLNAANPTWTNSSTGLPMVPVNCLVVDPANSNNVYVGTDIGVYGSTDAGANWLPYGTNLPIVAVFGIALTQNKTLRIATHGRGMWQVPTEAVCTPPTVNAPTVTQPTCATPTGTIVANATGGGTLEYSADNGTNWQTSATFSGLAAGNYNIIVRLQANPTCSTAYASNPVVLTAATGCSIQTQSVAAGQFHSLFIKNDGTVWATGANTTGQLGDGSNTNTNSSVQVSGLMGIAAIAGGAGHSLFLKSDGTVWATGVNINGELGNGNNTNTNMPVQVPGLTGITAISAGNNHSLFLKNDGTVWATGFNYYGQLGNGSYSSVYIPVQVSGLTGIIAIAGGGNHSLFLKNDGTVWAAGNNSYGQLGDGSNTGTNIPVQVSGLTGITAIAGGLDHSLFVKNDGTVWATGFNYYGQLGTGNNTNTNSPVQVSGLTGITAIAGGGYHSLFLKNDGTVWSTGYNSVGPLGDGTNTDRNSPVQVSGLTGITAIAGGQYHSLFEKNNATFWATGQNYYGTLGDCTNTDTNIPVQGLNCAGCTPPTITAPTVTQPTCATPTGTIVVNATGGTFEYSVDNGGNWQASATFSGLAPGNNYNIKVRFQASPTCMSTYTGNPVVLTAATGCCTPPTITAPTVTQPTCATLTGTIVVNATGGTFEYSVDNGGNWQASATFSGLAPGSYNIKVRFQASPTCMATYTGNPVVLTAATGCCTPPTITAPTVTQPTCATPTGTIVVNATGGTFEYSVDNGTNWQASATFSGLVPGSYNIKVRFQASPTCMSTYTGNPVVLTAATGCCTPPTITAPTVTQPTCATLTGTIVVNATGGTFEYSVDNGGNWQANATFSGLAPGSYNIKVRFQASPTCMSTYTGNPVVLTAATGCCTPPTITAPTVTQPTCATLTGTIVVNATGGTFEYSVDNGGNWQASATFSGLAPGSYNIKVRFQASPTCMSTYTGNPVVLTAATGCCTPPTITAPTVTQPTCATLTGTIVVNATGGTFEYSVDNGGNWQASATFSGLVPGSYNIKVRFQASPTCMSTYTGNPVVLTAATGCCTPPTITAQTVTQPTCATPTGTIVVNATGGTFEYSVDNGGNWQASATFSGLAPGSYNIKVRFQASPTCMATYTGNPVVLTAATGCCTPPTITVNSNISQNNDANTCGASVTMGANLTVTGSPAPTVTYSLTNFGATISNPYTFAVGTTTVWAKASNTCGDDIKSFTVTVVDNQPPVITCPGNITVPSDVGVCGAVVTYAAPTVTDNCGGASAALNISQSTNSTTIIPGTVACYNAGLGITRDNRFLRKYDLSTMALSGPYTINKINWGIEVAGSVASSKTGRTNTSSSITNHKKSVENGFTEPGGANIAQTVTLNVYTLTGAFIYANMTLVASEPVVINDQTNTLMSTTLSSPPTVPANAMLVLEIYSPDGESAGTRFFPASNSLGQSAPGYLASIGCGVPQPTDYAALGFPNIHLILDAEGVVNGAANITQTAGLPSGSFFPEGVTTNTFQALDEAGNPATCSFTVTVNPGPACCTPAITCPAPIVVGNAPGLCSQVVTYNMPTVVDNCNYVCQAPTSIANYTYLGEYGGHRYFRSNFSRTWNSANANAQGLGAHLVTITSAAEAGFLTANYNVFSWIGLTDEVTEGTFKWVTGEPFVYSDWRAGDPNGGTAENYVARNFYGAPQWVDMPQYTNLPFVIEFDCEPRAIQTAGLPSGATYPVGVTTNTFSYTSSGGSTVTCSFTVTVNDTELPVLSCPGNIVVQGSTAQVVNYSSPTLSDNCLPACTNPTSIPTYTYLGNFAGHTYFISNFTRNWNAANASAMGVGGHLLTLNTAAERNFVRSATTTFAWIGLTDEVTEGNFKWVTNEPFTFSDWRAGEPNGGTSENYVAMNFYGNREWVDMQLLSYLPFIVEFECTNGIVQTAGLPSGSAFPVGVTTNTFEYTDGNSNTGTCSFTVTVQNAAPFTRVDNADQDPTAADFSVAAYPNPSASAFTIMVNSESDLPVQVRILDVNGKVYSSSRVQVTKGGTFKVGENLTSGTWFAEITQGNQRKVVRLYKIK